MGHPNDEFLLHFNWEWFERNQRLKHGCLSSLLNSDWLSPNRLIAHYPKIAQTSALFCWHHRSTTWQRLALSLKSSLKQVGWTSLEIHTGTALEITWSKAVTFLFSLIHFSSILYTPACRSIYKQRCSGAKVHFSLLISIKYINGSPGINNMHS